MGRRSLDYARDDSVGARDDSVGARNGAVSERFGVSVKFLIQ